MWEGENSSLVTETIGSSPYKFVRDEFVPGSRVVYTRNPAYEPRQEPAEWTSGGKMAHFDRIEWHVIPDAATAAAALQAGEVDWYEHVQTDWGTVSQRRNNRESVDKGGWSVVHTWGTTTTIGNPVSQFFMRGVGETGWAGWFKDDEIERLTEQWLLAETDRERASLADALQARAFQTVPSIPLGQFQIRTAYRRTLTGLLEASGALPWNIRRV